MGLFIGVSAPPGGGRSQFFLGNLLGGARLEGLI